MNCAWIILLYQFVLRITRYWPFHWRYSLENLFQHWSSKSRPLNNVVLLNNDFFFHQMEKIIIIPKFKVNIWLFQWLYNSYWVCYESLWRNGLDKDSIYIDRHSCWSNDWILLSRKVHCKISCILFFFHEYRLIRSFHLCIESERRVHQ